MTAKSNIPAPIPASLGRRVTLALLGAVSLIFVVFSAVIGGYYIGGREAQLQHQLHQVIRLAETSLPEALWKLDLRSVDDILRAILANDAVVFVQVEVEGRVVARQSKESGIDETFEHFGDNGAYLQGSAVIRRNFIEVGRLQLIMSKEAIFQELQVTAVAIVGLFFLLILTISCTCLPILRHYFLKPLATLERAARLIAEGRLETRIDINSRDEIGSLASTLRIMTRRLREYFENLEQKVRERTAELSQATLAAEETNRSLALVGAELEALLDNSPVGIAFIDSRGAIKRASREMETITGYSPEELHGNSGSMLYATPAGYKKMVEKILPLLRKQGRCEVQAALQRKDGGEVLCRLHGRVVTAAGGLEGVVWSVEDITTRVRMESELLKTKKQESITILAGGIAHDFNNILFAVIGNISLAERLVGEPGPLSEHLRIAREAAVRAKELTSRLIDFAGGASPVKATVSLPELVRGAASLVLPQDGPVRLRFAVSDDLWSVSMDKEQISQVIVALVNNGAQAMPEGGTLAIALDNVELIEDQEVGLIPGRYVKITLTDQGRGIAAHHLDKIFDPYFSTQERGSIKGSGLGLAIVHSIINKHEGKISVESVLGRGTTFTLYLPAEAPVAQTGGGTAAILPAGRGTVLVMRASEESDDLAEMLHHIGFTPRFLTEPSAVVENCGEAMRLGVPVAGVLAEFAGDQVKEADAFLAGLRRADQRVPVVVSCNDAASELFRDNTRHGFSGAVLRPYKLLDLNRALAVLKNQ
jgi:PAS domain S-box-containing protein